MKLIISLDFSRIHIIFYAKSSSQSQVISKKRPTNKIKERETRFCAITVVKSNENSITPSSQCSLLKIPLLVLRCTSVIRVKIK